MDCNDFDRLLEDCLNGELSPASKASYEAHMRECKVCCEKATQAATLRNRLRAEFVPIDPEGKDSFHSFKREMAVRESARQNRRRFSTVRALGFASVIVLLVGYLFINVPVSYSLPGGMSIIISFKPPLADAPEFKGLILPKEFYDEVASSEDVLIDRFVTVQNPDGLTRIEMDINSDDPEIAAKVYKTLIKNYPALEVGEVSYHGIEDEKREPLHVMIKELHGSDNLLSDEEIQKVIIMKMPEINQWIDEEMMPLVKGIEIRVSSDDEDMDIDELMSQCQVKVLKIMPDSDHKMSGSEKKQFQIIIGDDEACGGISKDICVSVGMPFGHKLDIFTEEDLAKLKKGEINTEEFEKIIVKRIKDGDCCESQGKVGVMGGTFDEACITKLKIDLDEELLEKFERGEISEKELQEKITQSITGGNSDTDVIVKVIRLEDGALSFGEVGGVGVLDISKEICGDVEKKMKEIQVTLGETELDMEEISKCLDILKNCDETDPDHPECKKMGIMKMEDCKEKFGDDFIEDILGSIGDTICSDLKMFSGSGGYAGVKTDGDCKIIQLEIESEKGGRGYAIAGTGDVKGEIITEDEMKSLHDGDITVEELEELVLGRLKENEMLENGMMLCLANDFCAITVMVDDGEVHIKYDPID